MKKKEITYKQFQEALKTVNEYKLQIERHHKEVTQSTKHLSRFHSINKDEILFNADLSVRLFNLLRFNEDKLGLCLNGESKISELSKISLKQFIKCRNAGKKTIDELKELCFYAGIELQP